MLFSNCFNKFSLVINSHFTKRSALIIVLSIGILIPLINNDPIVTSFFYLAKWTSFFFVIYHACLVLTSFVNHAPKSNSGRLYFFQLETLSFVYILFAVYYIGKGACKIDEIGRISWVISENFSLAVKAEGSDVIWKIFNMYQLYILPIMLGFIFMILIVNCSRSYYKIHELDLEDKGYLQKNSWLANTDWTIRILIAAAFICFEKKISHIGDFPLKFEPLCEEFISFAYGGIVLYSLIVIWYLINKRYKIRQLELTQFFIGFGGVSFSLTLLLTMKSYDINNHIVNYGVTTMLVQLTIYTLMLFVLMLSGMAIVIDFISPEIKSVKPNIT